MPVWRTRALRRIKDLADARKVRFTLKALRELAALGLDEDDACDLLANLTGEHCSGRQRSRETGEWMYVFTPAAGGAVLYIKVILRSDCVLISFHEDEGDA